MVVFSVLFTVYCIAHRSFIRICSSLIQDHRENYHKSCDEYFFKFPFWFMRKCVTLLSQVGTLHLNLSFFFEFLLTFLCFLIFKECGLSLYIIMTVIEFYMNLFQILILQNNSGNLNVSIFHLFDQGLLVHETKCENLGKPVLQKPFHWLPGWSIFRHFM